MTKLIVLIVIIILILVFYKRFNRSLPTKTHTRPTQTYQKSISLFTPEEQHFLITLEEAIETLPLRLYGKTTLGNLIKTRTNSMHNGDQIITKQFDFILVHRHNFSPLLAIKLGNRQDPLIDEIMAQIDIPILNIPPANKYSSELLKGMIMSTLKIS